MTDEQQKAIDVLRSGNIELAELVKNATRMAVKKAVVMIGKATDPKELQISMSTIESATKVVGLSPKESQTNIQINAINGFEFIEYDGEELIELTQVTNGEEYAEVS